MTQPLNIVSFVHSAIIDDARVRKTVKSLAREGHSVEVFGFDLHGVDPCPSLAQDFAEFGQNVRWNIEGLPFGFAATRKLAVLTLFLGLALVVAFFLTFLTTPLLVVSFTSVAVCAGVLVYALKRLLFEFYIALRFYFRSRDWDIDTIFANDIAGLIAGVMVKKTGRKLVWDAHEIYTGVVYCGPVYRWTVDKLIRLAAPRIDAFVTISESMAEYYNSKYPRLHKGSVLPNVTVKAESKTDDGRLREAAGYDCEGMICLYQGALAVGRGIEETLLAVPLVQEDWRFVFMGEGPLSSLIDEAAKSTDRIRRIPAAPYEELQSWTCGADLGLVLMTPISLSEAHSAPNKMWEYPNASVPILASDLIEHRRHIQRFGIGALVPSAFSAEQLADALNSLDSDTLEGWRENCVKLRETVTWESYEPVIFKAVSH